MKKKKLLLFDLDGTLVRTGGAGVRAISKAFKIHYDLDEPLEGVTVAGNTDPRIYREVLGYRKSGLSPSRKEEVIFFESYFEFLKEEIEKSPGYRVLPGILQILTLASTSCNFVVGLGTGNLEKGARIKLGRGGLNPYFSFGGFASDSPDRVELLKKGISRAKALSQTKIESENIFIIGDTPRDIEVAKILGTQAIAVATGGYDMDKLKPCLADYLVETLEDIDAFFEFVEMD
ncbi:MAG: HAD hydrolase-like protein [Chlamydiae bacterium]|nr:HAD hydrolase-like protein [Chlamydiota bacterium]MBI3266332.1 HAD hydrolase-like protein [Chlamydiota bacterium]